jgi:tetratricopeptide (TPR) repeat protein
MAEHRMYLPLAAVVAPGVVGIHLLIGRRSRFVFLALVAGLGTLTAMRNEDYRSEQGIWNDTAAKRPGNPLAHYNLGVFLAQANRIPEAIEHYAEAVRLKPDYADAHNNLAIALIQTGRIAEAIAHFAAAVRLQPGDASAHFNLGNILAQADRRREAIEQYTEAVRLQPDFAEARANLARLQTFPPLGGPSH